MCGGGGGGGGISAQEQALIDQQNRDNERRFQESQALAREQFDFQREQVDLAQAREFERQGRIAGATNQINGVFAGRSGLYDQLEDATFDINRDRLVEGRDDSRRGLKFGLARAGLGGSSVDVDRNEQLQDRFNQGLVDARNTAQTAGNNAKAADAQIQGSLVSAASTGNFSGSDLLNSASGALASTANTAPVIVPQFANDTYFSDIVNGLGNVAFQLGGAFPQQGQRSSGSSRGSSSSGTVRGG